MKYGYARVSTREQKEDRQIIAIENYGVKANNIYVDKQSGKDFERVSYKRLLRSLKKGDVLVVKSIDRLGRNYREIIRQWQYITQEIEADIVVLDMKILDTTQHKDLIGTLISDIVLQLLSYVAENERINIRQRQAEGIAAAKANGIKFGRPKKYIAEEYIETFVKYKNKELSNEQARSIIGCGKNTFYRMLDELKMKGCLC